MPPSSRHTVAPRLFFPNPQVNQTMTEFETYYTTKFRQDILIFFSTIPERSKHTFSMGDRSAFTIQYQTLTKDFNHLDFLDIKEKAFFGTALFFTVLVDQVCFSHFPQHYIKFRKLTLYPKFVGNSPSTDQTNFCPSEIFAAFNYSRDDKKKNETPRIEFWEVFNNALPVMEKETTDFFKKHLTEIGGQSFWDLCKREFPNRLKDQITSE